MAAVPKMRMFAGEANAVTDNPIQLAIAASNSDFNGDDINRPHDILWNKEDYLRSKGGKPAVSENCDVVVVGGGMSGLLAAYYLQNKNVVLLEQAPQFGGNAKGENYKGSQYSMGAAYVNVPDQGSRVEQLFQKLGLSSKFRAEGETQILWKNKITADFWSGKFDSQKSKAIADFHLKIKDIYDNHYPDVPNSGAAGEMARAELDALDNITFQDWVQQNFPEMAEEAMEYCQLYAWSSFGGSLDEISAAQMLNFLAAEVGGIMTLPGGNAAIAQALVDVLKKKMSKQQMQAGAFVIDIVIDGDGVVVIYENAAREVKALRAKKCVVAAPKMVAKYLIDDMPADQRQAMDGIRYRGYIVANVILNKKIESPSLELYWLQGSVPDSPRPMTPPDRAFTDTCFGTWAQSENVEQSVLTIYKALPMDGAQQFLFNPIAFAKNKKAIQDGFLPLLNSLNLKSSDVAGMRLTRWGHSMPLAEKGFIASGVPEILLSSIDDKIYFANQDNWVNPAFETAEAVAFEVSAKI
jgi:protoporphyrinogen oxidase